MPQVIHIERRPPMTLNTIARMFANGCSRSRNLREATPGELNGNLDAGDSDWVKRSNRRRRGCTGAYRVNFPGLNLEIGKNYECVIDDSIVFKFLGFTLVQHTKHQKTYWQWAMRIIYLAAPYSVYEKDTEGEVELVDFERTEIIRPAPDLMLFLHLPYKYPDFEKELFARRHP
jgi:hypothetical protein